MFPLWADSFRATCPAVSSPRLVSDVDVDVDVDDNDDVDADDGDNDGDGDVGAVGGEPRA